MAPPATPANATRLQHVAKRLNKQHGRQTASVVLKEYIRGHNPAIGDNTAQGIAKDLLDGDTTSLKAILPEQNSHDDCACVNKSRENPDNFTRVKSGVVHKSDNEFIIRGPASVSIVDSEGDKITGPALKQALPQLLKRANLSLEHMDIQPGEILEKWEAPSGETYRTEVREVTKGDLDEFPGLVKAGVEPGDDALFLVAKVYDDTQYSRDVRKEILDGTLRSFSISGQAVSERTEQKCDDAFDCKLVNVIEKLDLSAVTLCETPMNQAATGFKVLSKAQKREAVERGWMQKTHDGCPGGFHGLVETVAALADDDDKGEALKKRAGKARATLDGHDPEDEAERELYGVLAALVDAAEEGEHDRVDKMYERFMRAYGGDVEERGADPEIEDGELKADAPGEDVPEGAEDLVEAEEDLDEAVAEGDLEDAEDAAELVEHHAEDLQEAEYEAEMKALKKQLPPDTDHDVVEPLRGTPSHPSKRPTHGEVHPDQAIEALDAEYNPDYPGNADRMEGAGAGPARDASEGERETGELEEEKVEKALAKLAKDCDCPDSPVNEDFWEDDEDEPLMKPAPEGVNEAEYDSCVEQVKDEGSAENAYAVCADALQQKNGQHKQDMALHKQLMAQHGFDKVYNRNCPTCYKLKAHEYEDAHAYFDAARHLRKTGALRIGWLSPKDAFKLREERGVFLSEIPTVGRA